MSERLLFLFGGHLRSFAGIEADENNFVIAPGIEREHSQHADDALFDLIAKHGAAVIDEGEDHWLLLAEIVAKLNAAASFVTEGDVERHGTVERRLEPYVLQNRGHSRSPAPGAGRNSLRAPRRASGPQEGGNPKQMGNFFHACISFSPPTAT